jgi:predicted permease
MRFERWVYTIPLRLRSLLRRGRVEAELDEELRYHLERQVEENLARGMTAEEAREAALRAMGGVEQRKEECRDARRVTPVEDFVRDLRYGLRVMLKHPGFTAVAVLSLALGIGANTTIFSMVNGFILRPLPVQNPEELVVPFWGGKTDAEAWGPFSYANYVDLRERNKSLSGLLAVTLTSAGISSGDRGGGASGRAEVVLGEVVSGNYFDVLGVEPVLGRGFLPEEDRAQNAHPVAVISHALWQRWFNADPSVLGKTIQLNGSPFTVVGVVPETFKGVEFGARPSFWVPLMMLSKFGPGEGWEANRGWRMFELMGRLRPGVTAAQAEADLNLALEDLSRLYPTNENTKIQIVSELDGRFSSASGFFKFTSAIALCVSGLVLLVACANVANLMLARAVARTREIGIRLAIGASRFRVVRQLLTESLLLASLGGALGWLLARWGTGLVNASLPPMPLPVELDVSPDLTVFKWVVAVSLLTGVISGLAPALLASRPDLVAVIKGDGAAQAHGSRGRRWSLRGVLVVAQVAISVVVLICAGLFLRSLNKALHVDPGFSSENLVTMRLNTGFLGYAPATSERFYTELLRRVESLPGVRAASLADHLPLENGGSLRDNVMKEGEPDPLPNEGLVVACNVVGPKYFEAVRTPLVVGRGFTEQDDGDAPRVVIVNQEFARRFYGGERDALGKRFRFWHTSQPLMEIVGVARDGRYENLYEDPLPFMFLPHSQHFESDMSLLISATSAADLKAVTERARQEIARMDARMPVFAVQVAEQNLSFAYWAPRLAAGMSTAFGLLALTLATTGLYGVMTYAVTQRTREIGVRMALGAKIADVLKLILGQGVSLVLVGIAVGLAGAFAVTRVLSGMLLGVGATDAVTFLGVAVLLVAVGSLACWIPARRAARVDPLRALRYE